jgi:hypothetical protein
MVSKWNKAYHPHRLNLHEVKIGQEAKEEVLRVQADRARPQMRPHRRPSRAGLKEPTTFSVASRQRVASTTAALMEVSTPAKHTMERLVGTTIRRRQQCSPYNAWAYRFLLKLVYEMNMGHYLLECID